MIEIEYKTLAVSDQRVLICGSTSLVDAIAKDFVGRKIPTVICDGERGPAAEVDIGGTAVVNLGARATLDANALLVAAGETIGGISLLVNVFCPAANGPKEHVLSYAGELLKVCTLAAEQMAAAGIPGCIVNHSMLPAIYAGTDFEDHMSILRGAIVGVVRSIARRFGKQGIRCIGVQTGLIDIPECKVWISEKLSQVDIPGKRWGTTTEVAKLVAFLGLDATYVTGQTIVLDGGLTSGITGT